MGVDHFMPARRAPRARRPPRPARSIPPLAGWLAPFLVSLQVLASLLSAGVAPTSSVTPWQPGSALMQGSDGIARLASHDPDGQTIQDVFDMIAGMDSLRRFVGPDPANPATPKSGADLLSGIFPSGVTRLPLPKAPEGPEPLLQALRVYAETVGFEFPSSNQIRASILQLDVSPTHERALAALVLAYCQSVDLERAALSALSESDLSFLRGDVETMQAWFEADPERTLDGYERAAAELALQKVDMRASLQAADLLMRATDEARWILGLPVVDTVAMALASTPEPEAPEVQARPRIDALASPSVSPWAAVGALLDSVAPPPTAAELLIDPRVDLPTSMRRLTTALGSPETPLDAAVHTIPVTLGSAVATIVTAQAYGIETRDPSAQMRATLQAMQFAEPTLRAWASLLSLPAAAPPSLDRVRLVALAAAGPQAQPSELVAAALSAEPSARVLAPDSALAPRLIAEGLSPDQAVEIEKGLGPRLSQSLVLLLSAQDATTDGISKAYAALDDLEREALRSTPLVINLLQEDFWTPDQAQLVGRWADALRVVLEAEQDLRDAQARSLQYVEKAVGNLLVPAPGFHNHGPPIPVAPSPVPSLALPLPSVPAVVTPTAPSLPPLPGECPELFGFSDCKNDVWFRTTIAGGILITGSKGILIDHELAQGDPRITIDLGGDDVYRTSAGAAAEVFLPVTTTSPTDPQLPARQFAVAIDIGGNDHYHSSQDLAQGAGVGFGVLGVLWDAAGNDIYDHEPPSSTSTLRGAQGYGALLGTGILVDGVGADRYNAVTTSGQGYGFNPIFDAGTAGVGGSGFLFDFGAEDDEFFVKSGQGSGRGGGSFGMILDLAGRSKYGTSQPARPEFQGGATGTAALGLLVDLAGDDSYSNEALAAGAMVEPSPGSVAKGDDRIWFQQDGTNAGLGIDLSPGDDDGDLFPNLVEMAAGSDPQDHDSNPSSGTAITNVVEEIQGRIEGVLSEVQNLNLTDPDADGYPTTLERTAGSDPEDPSSTPLTPRNGTIVQQVVCYNTLAPTLTAPPGVEPCVSLLTIGSTGHTFYNLSALVSIDLGGDDTYLAKVAGTMFLTGRGAIGAVALDVGGNDTYDTPSLSDTQGSSVDGGVSLLVDLEGNDAYVAAAHAQGAASGSVSDTTTLAGIGLLADFGGNDTYRASLHSQAFATQAGTGVLMDFAGDDHYVSDTQGFGRERSAGGTGQPLGSIEVLFVPGTALFFDADGRDTYVSQAAESRLRFNSTDASTVFAAQGNVLRGDAFQGNAFFFDNGTQEDNYTVRAEDGSLVEVSLLKNGMLDVTGHGSRTRSPSAVATVEGVRAFIDNPGQLNGDPDLDGVPTYAEILMGSAPNDPADTPGPGGGLATLLESPGAPSLDFGGSDDWLRIEPLGDTASSILSPGFLALPGLRIAGRGDSVHDVPAVFLVDLGGNDTYRQPYAGGMTPQLHHVYQGDRKIQQSNFFAGAYAPTAVSLLLDVSEDVSRAGNDTYLPDPSVCTNVQDSDGDLVSLFGANKPPSGSLLGPTPSPLLTVCPTLGGAFAGIAVMSDDGGRNRFDSSVVVDYTVNNENRVTRAVAVAYGVSQGAGFLGGIGILTTHNATNTFASHASARAREVGLQNPNPRPFAVARGVSQGAGWSGIGILAAFGDGSDSYSVEAHVESNSGIGNSMQAAGISQGAAQDGYGLLFDEGGSNELTAPQGFSQGYAGSAVDVFFWDGNHRAVTPTLLGSVLFGNSNPPQPTPDSASPFIGLLWLGTGRDFVTGEAFSQGSSAGTLGPILSYTAANASDATASMGALLNGGGSDVYQVLSPPSALRRLQCPTQTADYGQSPKCALSQGSAAHNGVGILMDLSGDDQYLAPDRTAVQAASHMGQAYLFDLGGNDVYSASGRAQAFSTTDNLPTPSSTSFIAPVRASSAILFDALGNDYYNATSRSLGYPHSRETGANSGALVALFVDGDGVDVYEYPDVAATDGANWNQGSATGGGVGAGVDIAQNEEAIPLLRENLAASGQEGAVSGNFTFFVTMNSTSLSPDDALTDNDFGSGRLYLVGLYDRQGPRAETVRRVSFSVNGRYFGEGAQVTDGVGEPLAFRLAWDTSPDGESVEAPVFPDGDYRSSATAFLDYADPEVAESQGEAAEAPDWTPHTVVLPHLVHVDNPPRIEASLSSNVMTRSGPPVTLTVKVRSDYPDETQPDGAVLVKLRPAADPDAVATQFGPVLVSAGQVEFSIDGSCGPTVCPDGRYLVDVEAQDNQGNPDPCNEELPGCPPPLELIIDNSPPVSRIEPDGFANASIQRGTGRLELAWVAADDPGDIGPGNVSGISSVQVLALDEQGNIVRDLGAWAPPIHSLVFLPVSEGEVHRFITVATDYLGFTESPCLPATASSPAEAPPCYRHKLVTQGSQQLQIDFILPTLDPCHVRPNEQVSCDAGPRVSKPQPIDFHVNATDPGADTGAGSGLSDGSVTIEIGPQSFAMPNLDGVHYALLDFDASAMPAEESPYTYTVRVRDAAGNERSRIFTAFLDDLPPRIGEPTISFRAGSAEFPEAKPGSAATFRVRVDDIVGTSVRLWVDARELEGSEHLDCTSDTASEDPANWVCSFAIPPHSGQEEPYHVVLNAMDEAGNTAARIVPIAVLGSAPEISNVEIVGIGHSNLTVQWDTDVPTTARILYGATAQLGRASQEVSTFQTSHEVELTGLAPSNTYYVAVQVVGRSGFSNASTPISVKTGSGYLLELVGFPPNDHLSGVQVVKLHTTSLLPGNQPPVRATVRVQDSAGETSPVLVDTVAIPGSEATATVELNTMGLADGAYVLLVDGARGGDQQALRSSAFRVDNTQPVVIARHPLPGAVLNDATPRLEFEVTDFGAPSLPASITVAIDGRPPADATVQAVPLPGRADAGFLNVTILEPLPDGPHVVQVAARDAAGNVGFSNLSVTIDTVAPVVIDPLRPEPDRSPIRVRPGGTLNLTIGLADDAGVLGAWVDLIGIGGGEVPFIKRDNGTWTTSIRFPYQLADGSHQLTVVAADRAGNRALAAAFNVTADRVPPQFQEFNAIATGFTTGRVEVVLSSPARLAIVVNGSLAHAAALPVDRLIVNLTGLQPSSAHAVEAIAEDTAGNEASRVIVIQTPRDDSPPTPVSDLLAVSQEEGMVDLSWSPAFDNAGLSHYAIELLHANGSSEAREVPPNATTFRDSSAPAGKIVTYRVIALDLAGLASDAEQFSLLVAARPHLSQGLVDPPSGRSDQPFSFRVTYRHGGGVPPDRIDLLLVDNEARPMHALGDADCSLGCPYEVEAYLATTTIQDRARLIRFVASAQGQNDTLVMAQSPLVLDDELGPRGAAPSVPTMVWLLLLVGIVAWRRRWPH